MTDPYFNGGFVDSLFGDSDVRRSIDARDDESLVAKRKRGGSIGAREKGQFTT